MPSITLDEFIFQDSKVVLKQLTACYYVFAKHQGNEIREIKHTRAEARTAFLEHMKTIRQSYEKERRKKLK